MIDNYLITISLLSLDTILLVQMMYCVLNSISYKKHINDIIRENGASEVLALMFMFFMLGFLFYLVVIGTIIGKTELKT